MNYLYSFALSTVLMYLSMAIGIHFGLLDKPKGLLKPHEKPIPFTGGLGILLALVLTAFLFNAEIFSYLFPLSILWILGFVDDLKGLSPKLRLLTELVVGFGFSFFDGNPVITSLILAFVFAAIINAFNMVDGMDGLCGGLSLVIAIAFSFIPGLGFFRWIVPIIGAFLIFNIAPARMFLGDEGSYLLGGFFGIAFIKAFNSGFGLTAFGILWLPLLDLTLGFLRRALNGKSPFEGDRDHFYDKLKKLYIKNTRTIMVISMVLASIYAFPSLLMPNWFLLAYLLLVSIIQTTVLKSLKIT